VQNDPCISVGEFSRGFDTVLKERRSIRGYKPDPVLRGFRQFDAPASIVMTYDKELQHGDIAQFVGITD
jgi:hypothetical protein